MSVDNVVNLQAWKSQNLDPITSLRIRGARDSAEARTAVQDHDPLARCAVLSSEVWALIEQYA
ncbi:MAG: hypothetical protein M3Y18_09125 [Candidatus Eremiobacteraeota bacterium]|nr:hypothetical protein [Candidatus Eremiobacteraeota bacterium]